MWLIAALLVAFVSLIPEGSRDVSAVSPSTTTWDTTSDFDNGTKVDTGAKWFAENGIDQPSDWIAFPRSWSFNGRTYTAWQGDTDYKIYIIYYDHIDGVWAAPVVIQGLNPINGDGHGSPAIGITNDGYLHVFCCAHGGEQEYFRSTNPQSIEKWTNKTTAIAIPTSSYPHVEVLPNGKMYLFYRENLCGSGGRYDYKVTQDDGNSWSAARTILDLGGSACGYIGNTEQNSNRIYMSWTRSQSAVERNVYSGFLDLSTDHMFCGTTDLGITIDDTENTNNCLVVNSGAKETGTCCSVQHVDAGGNIYLIYSIQNGSSTNYDKNFTRWTGSSWTAPQYILTTGFWQNLEDFRIFSSTDVRGYFITPVASLGPSPNAESGNLDEYRWNGATWTFFQTIMSGIEGGRRLNSNAEGLNYPQIVRNYMNGWWLTFASRVFYTSPADGRLYAYGDSGFLRRTATPSGTLSVETTTDNPSVSAGRLSLSSGLGDAFATADSDADTGRWFWGESGAYSSITHAITGGVLQIGMVDNFALARTGIMSRFRVSGDFDVRVKIAKQDTGSSFNTGNFFMLLDKQAVDYDKNNGGTATLNGILYERWADTTLRATTVTNGVGTLVGSAAFPAFPACERITRTVATNTITWYYATGACTSWTTHQTTTFATAANLYIIFSAFNNGAHPFTARYDVSNYQVFSGTVVGGGTVASSDPYRTSGIWRSPTQDVTGLFPATVVITYSGASSTYPVNLAIVEPSGFIIDQVPAPITTGVSYTWTISATDANFAIPWIVQVSPTGDGLGSAVVDSVTLSTGLLNPYGPGSGTVIPSFIYGPHLTLLDAFSDNLVYFQDNSLIPASFAPATYVWDFGDGSYAKGSAVSHNYNYSLVATFTVKLLICGGPPGAIQCYVTTRSITLFQWHILAVALFILGSAAGSLYAIAYYARHARLPPRGFVTKRVVYWMRR